MKVMSENGELDTEEHLVNVLNELQPRLRDLIKRSFHNLAIQQINHAGISKKEKIGDISYSSKHTQVNLTNIEMTKALSFHVQNISLDLNAMNLGVRCSHGEISFKGFYSAFNENLYNLLPVMSEGHVLVKLSNVFTELDVGLGIKNDKFSLANPNVEVTHDEITVQLSWPVPQPNGEYEFVTTEQIARHMDDLPVTIALNQPLNVFIRRKLLDHLETLLKTVPDISDLFCCVEPVVELYCSKVSNLSSIGNKVIDLVLINVRRTLFQNQREILELQNMIASFVHKVGPLSFVGKFETDNGWVKNLATINRICDVSVKPGAESWTFYATLKIKDLQLGFDVYKIRLPGGAGASGRLLVTIADNSIYLCITAGINQWQPYSQLDQLKVDYFDNLDLHITGLGELNWITDRAAVWTAGYLRSIVSQAIERQLKAELHRAFTEINLWDVVKDKVL